MADIQLRQQFPASPDVNVYIDKADYDIWVREQFPWIKDGISCYPTRLGIRQAIGGVQIRTLNAGPAGLVFTGSTAGLNVSRLLAALPGVLTFTGGTATLDYVPHGGTTFTLVADPAALNFTGAPAGLNVIRVLPGSGNSLVLTGSVATLNLIRRLLASPAGLTFTGQNASFTIGRTLQATPGSLVFGAGSATLDYIPAGGGGVPVRFFNGVTLAKERTISQNHVNLVPTGGGNYIVTLQPSNTQDDQNGPSYEGYEW
jgi:hypothetical protein